MADEIELNNLEDSKVTRRMSRSPDPMPPTDHSNLPSQNSDVHPSRHDNMYPWQLGHARTAKDSLQLFLISLWRGPRYPRDDPPQPILSLLRIEVLPEVFRRVISAPIRKVVLFLYILLWSVLAFSVLLPYLTKVPTVDNDPSLSVMTLTCSDASKFWKGKNAACGLNAKDCPAFSEDKDIIIRCPALCDRGSWLYSMRAIGDELVKYRGYFVGGGKKTGDSDYISYPYRADSFPCGAAVHAGIISPLFGGCARMSYSSGPQAVFSPAHGYYGVSDSIGFHSFFPRSYAFKPLNARVSRMFDPRFSVLILNILMGLPIVFFGSGAVFTWTIASVGFWTITLATDPPILVEPQEPETFYQLISVSLGRFLPTCFVLFALWKLSIKRTFSFDHPAQYEGLNEEHDSESRPYQESVPKVSHVTRLVLWYPFFWLGILNNVTFDRLPVDRLTWHDLQVQPGALLTVSIVVCILIFCVVAQAYYVWLLGRFWKLLSVYGLIFATLFFLANIPGLTLRIHHYIFALVFIPGCSTKGRTAYIFQGLLLGLFLSGVARWDFAPIAETNISLLRGEPTGRIFAPVMTNFDRDSGNLYWEEFNYTKSGKNPPPSDELAQFTDISLLVNDIERVRIENEGFMNILEIFQENDELKLMVEIALHTDAALDEQGNIEVFLRIAKYNPTTKKYGDFSRATIFKYPSQDIVYALPGVT